MRRLPGLVAIAVLAATGASAAEPSPGASLGTDPGAVSAALADGGWTLTRFEIGDRWTELTAIKDARRIDVDVDPATGTVVRVAERRRVLPQPGADGAAIRVWLAADEEDDR